MAVNDQDTDALEGNIQIHISNDVPNRPFVIILVPMFLLMLGMSLASTPIGNILLYRTCVHALDHSVSDCQIFLSTQKANKNSTLEVEVQKYMTFVSTVSMVLQSIVPAGLCMFLGVWSDTYGRKPLITWPLFGLCFSSMSMVVYSLLDNLGPWWYQLCVIPLSLSGGMTILFTGSFCYVSDVTSNEWKSLRMTILESVFAVGTFIGLLLSAPLLRAVGNVYLLLIVATLHVIAYCVANVYLKESLTGALKGGLNTVLDWLLVKEMARECFKRRPNHGRAQILLLSISNCMILFIMYGLNSYLYLYTRDKLHWTLQQFNTYSAVNTVIQLSGGFLGIFLLQKVLRLSDLTVAMIGFASIVADYFTRAFAVTTWNMYTAGAISAVGGLPSPLIRSFLTKILPVEDIAKVFALISAIEGICPLISPPLYNALYDASIATFPGAIYILSACIYIGCFIALSFVQFYRWNTTSPYQPLHIDN